MTTSTDTLTADQRASKVAKITALLQKTEANGCTADEASAARVMADRLMAQYSITEAECQPITARRPGMPTGDWFKDFQNEARAQEQARRSTPEGQAAAQERARANYRRAGVHIDEGYHPDCKCSMCKVETAGQYNAGPFFDFMADEPSRGRGTTRPGRKNHSHAGCDHEATSSARARCRKNRGY